MGVHKPQRQAQDPGLNPQHKTGRARKAKRGLKKKRKQGNKQLNLGLATGTSKGEGSILTLSLRPVQSHDCTEPADVWLVFAAELTGSSLCAFPLPKLFSVLYLPWKTLTANHLFETAEVCSSKRAISPCRFNFFSSAYAAQYPNSSRRLLVCSFLYSESMCLPNPMLSPLQKLSGNVRRIVII